jgi:hypothetical protein
MNKIMTKAALLALALIVSVPIGLMAQDEGFYPYSFARLTYVNGSVYVQRTADLGYEKGEVNLALVQGDKIGTESGQAEIHFGRRNYLRLGDNTKVEFAILPKEGEDRIKLFLTEGRAYLRVSQLALEKGVEVHTPDASFYVLEEGLYRFDVRLDRETQVVAREGSLEAAAEAGSVLVQSGDTVTAADGRLTSDPEYDYARGDAFDDWNGSRDGLLSARSERQYLPSDMGEYEEELDENGRWVYEQPYGNVWVPNVSYEDDWRPYSYGRWMWYPVIGWTWISSESWGWPVYHYGRWNWRFGLGWYWIPRSHWGPAWVHWWNDNDYIGWCPLTWYNRPGYLFNDRFYDRWNDRYFSAHNRAMTVIRRDHLQSPDIGRRRLGGADLDRIGRVELRAQQPGIRPSVDNGRPQAIAARKALEDRSGARGRIRNVAPSNSLASPRQGGLNSGLRSRERNAPVAGGDRQAIARPSVRGSENGGRTIRSYPSQRLSTGRDQNGASESRRGSIASPGRGAATRVSPSQERSSGREPGGAVARRGSESVKSDPPASNGRGAADKGRSTASTPRAVRSGAERSSPSNPGRSQSRTYSSRSSVTSPSSRLSSPSTSSRSSSPSYSRSGSSRTPSYAQPRTGGSSSRTLGSSRSSSSSSGRTYSAPRSSGSSSGRSFSAPRSSGSSSGRSYSAPRSSSSGRSYSSPRSGGSSSSRSSGSVRSGGSSSSRSGSSGRSSSGSSRSSGSSSRSGGSAKRKG